MCVNVKIEKKQRKLDLSNMRFGRLLALKRLDVCASDGSGIWQCRCDCGNDVHVSSNKLRKGHTLSCGCLQREVRRNSRTYVGGICLEIIRSTKRSRNNTSGRKGVSARRKGWAAYINYAGVRYGLGCYKDIADAIHVRERAEELRLKHATENPLAGSADFQEAIRELLARDE